MTPLDVRRQRFHFRAFSGEIRPRLRSDRPRPTRHYRHRPSYGRFRPTHRQNHRPTLRDRLQIRPMTHRPN